MRDTPWHARPRAPEPSPATQPAPKQTTFRRLVLVNQELAQHNTKVRLASFPPAARGPRSRARPTLTTTPLSCPQLRQDLADARRRAAVAANAEAQAGIAVAMHRERQAEAARLRRELLVRERPALGLSVSVVIMMKRISKSVIARRKKKRLSDDASPLLARLLLRARPQTSLSDAREEIRKLKIQVDAQASLLRLQRALDTSPANRSTNRDASPAASTTTRREPEEAAKKSPSKPPSPEPWSPVRGVSNTLGLVPPISKHTSNTNAHEKTTSRDGDACVSQSRENEKTEASTMPTMPPPATRRPRVNLRGFAARETTSPATRRVTNGGLSGLEPRSSPPSTATTPRRQRLRYRHKAVVYTEPSLKTKMRRPRTPPPAARAPASVAVEANPVFPKPFPETVSAANAAAADAAEDERLLGPSSDDAASSEEEASTTPLAFVTSRRHRRRRAVAPFDS